EPVSRAAQRSARVRALRCASRLSGSPLDSTPQRGYGWLPQSGGAVMVRRVWPVLGVLALVGGCGPLDGFKASDGGEMPGVGPSPFGAAGVQTASFSTFTPSGDHEVALHVDCVARKVKAANKDTGLDPKFAIVGVQAPELFHQGTHVVYVTEGLVKSCKSEG